LVPTQAKEDTGVIHSQNSGNMNPQLDPQALNLAKAIRRAETGTSSDPYNARGASGEMGGYQFMPDTWKQWAGQYLQDSNAEMTVENQNKVAYSRIKELKDQGYNPAQIASLWNSGDANSYTGFRSDGKTPTVGRVKNSAGVEVDIDVPEYTRKVSQYYRELSSGQSAPIGPTQFQTTVPRKTPEQGVLSQLGTGTIELPKEPGKVEKRLAQGSEALGKLSTGIAEGDLSQSLSGTIQTGGAVAGGIVDLTDAALGLIPGYDATMDFVGKKVIAPLLQGLGGESVYNQWQQFAQENPEFAKNLSSFGNMVSVLPLFKAVRVGGGMVADAARTGVAKTGFIKTVEDATKAEIRQSGASAPSKAGEVLAPKDLKGVKVDPVDTIVDGDYLPDVIEDANGIPRYSSTNAIKKLDDELDVNEQTLQRALEEASRKGLVGYVPMTALRTEAEKLITKAFANRGQVDSALHKAKKIFDDYTKYKGDLVPLTELNEMKRGIREAVNFNSPKLGADVRTHLGSLFMETIEDVAEKQGMKMVADLNRDSMMKIRAKEALDFLDQRSVVERPGFRTLVGRRSGDLGTIAGESVGQSFGVPGVGAAIGRGITNRAISGAGKSSVKKLKNKRNRKRPGVLTSTAAGATLMSRHTQEEPSQKSSSK